MSTQPEEIILDGGSPSDDLDVIDGGELKVPVPTPSLDGGSP